MILLALALAAGAPAMLRGQASPAWSAESPLPKTAPTNACRGGVPNNMVVTVNGRAYIFYFENSGSGGGNVAKFTWTDDHGASWAAPLNFSPTGTPLASLPSVALAPDGFIHAVWAQGGSVRHTRLAVPAHTYAPVLTAGTHASKAVAFNQITVDTSGRAHVIWHAGNPATGTEATLAESWYARLPAGAPAFDTALSLGTNPALHAAFPSADFSGCDGSFLAVAWRQTTPGNNGAGANWDVILRTSHDAGVTWAAPVEVASGSDRQLDPILIVDRQDIIHLAYHGYPWPAAGIVNYIHLGHSTDGGVTWRNHDDAAGFMRVSPVGEDHLLCKAAYDPHHDIVHYFWKRRRGGGEDIMAAHILRRGRRISAYEFITDLGGTSAGFHNFAVGPDGRARCHYHRSLVNPADLFDQSTIFYRERDLPPALTPELAAWVVAGTLHIRWDSEYGASYTIESSGDLADWSEPPPVTVTGSGDEMSASSAASGGGRMFMRVRAER